MACTACLRLIAGDATFCPYCGAARSQQKQQSIRYFLAQQHSKTKGRRNAHDYYVNYSRPEPFWPNQSPSVERRSRVSEVPGQVLRDLTMFIKRAMKRWKTARAGRALR